MSKYPAPALSSQMPPRATAVPADRFLAAIVDSSDDAIIGKSLDGIITSWNLAAERLYGYTADEAIGRHISLIIPADRPNELPMIMAQLRQGQRIDHFETVRVDKDGTHRDISVSISPIHDDTGAIVGAASIGRDITGRRQVEADLRATETRYRALVEQLPVVVALNAPDKTQSTLYISPNCEAIFGYTPDEYLADPTLWIRTIHPDDRDWVLASLARMNATGEAVQDAYRMIARDGRVVWILEDSTLVRDDDGQPLYWQTVQVDVTARKEAEQALQQSEERFRTAFDSATIGMDLVDLDGRFLQVNSALCELTGYSEEELLARTFQDITLPEDQEADLALVNQLLAGRIPSFQLEKRYVRKDGHIIWGRVNSSLVRDQNGVPLHFIGMIEDITDRKVVEAERSRLQAELEAELQRAAEIQAQLLPQATPDLPQYEFAGTCLPARQVGGDFYDWLAGDDAIRFSLGDVMGKGMSASLLTATVRAALRVVTHLPVSVAVEAVNQALSPDLVQSGSFITLFHAALEPGSGQVTYVDAGHGMAFIQRRGGLVEELRQRGLPLGVWPDAAYLAGTTTLEPGDTLVIYSDGLPDARPDLRLDAVGVAGQISEEPDAHAKMARLVNLVSDIQVRPDDLTMVLVHRREEGAVTGDPGETLFDHPDVFTVR